MTETTYDETQSEELPEEGDAPEPVVEPEEDEEAAAAEEEEAQQEPEPESSAMTDLAIDKAMKALVKEAARHAGRVGDIMGEDAQTLEPCPLCAPNIPGFRWPVPPAVEVVRAVKVAIGEPEQPPYRPDEHSQVCIACDGYGAVATGSKVAGQATARCLTCEGRGWTGERRGIVGAFTDTAATAAPAVDYGNGELPSTDPPEVAALKQLGYVVVPPIKPEPIPA
ncbi:MAG: hypothetical protein ACRDUT_00030 [Mycobacterium sp.]